ncbi:hypothetical protein LHP98_16125 [Rhodobacter sp. Har01]|uniref:hypothetical protein n=1 Tax=Rhodobacter sp. Har01 TaxID=2883999 RepID=UPI001D094CD9|nr:hypothetical protein [Rhodobacter sp. Har01]MCB6179650.1 hypothetical protein [Rhodobacter sp. Har01]
MNAATWRAQHRRGTLSKLETDPDLRAFVLARIDRLTFEETAPEVAAAFPPDRRTGVSRAPLVAPLGQTAPPSIAKSWLSSANPDIRQPLSDLAICNPQTL